MTRESGGFTPELVERVAQALADTPVRPQFLVDDYSGPEPFLDQAKAALESSGIAELTDALRKSVVRMWHVQSNMPDSAAKTLLEGELQCLENLLAKVGGNHG